MPVPRVVPLFVLLILGPPLMALSIGAGGVFDPPWLLVPLDLVFECALPLAVAWLAITAYHSTAVAPLLAKAVGMSALGLASGLSALLTYTLGDNAAVTIHNMGVLLAGIAFLTTSPVRLFAVPLRLPGNHHWHSLAALSAVALIIGALLAALHAGALPLFFVPGSGFTPLREIVLGSAVLCFGIAAFAWWGNYGPTSPPFVRWHTAGLLLMMLGLTGAMLEDAPGDLVSWLGLGAQFAGSVCFFVAVHHAGHDRGFVAALVHSALPYQPLVDSRSEGILVLDRKGTIFYSNSAARRLFRYADNDFDSRILDLPLPPAARGLIRSRLEAPVEDRFELTLSDVAGRAFPAEITTYFNPVGKRLQVWSIRDITRRREAEEQLALYREHLEDVVEERTEALRTSEERFRLIATSTPDHLFEQDRELRYTFMVNPQLGLTVDDVLGKTDADLVPAEDAERLIVAKREVLATGKPLRFDAAFPSRHGGEEFFEGSFVPRHSAAGEVDGLFGYFRNVTERKRTEQALRESEQRFRGLFDAMNEGLALHEIICDEEGRPVNSRILEVNHAFERHTGLSREEVVGRTLREVLPGAAPLLEIYGRVALTGEPTHFEFYNPQLRRHYEVSAYSPAPRRFAVILMDRTEMKRRTAELEAANKELETFAYSVSHDLRAPLRAIDGYVCILMEEYQGLLDDEGRKMFESVRRNANRMGDLIDDMLTFSRLGRTAIEPAHVDMDRLAREVADELKPKDRELAITIAPLPPVRGDKAMLRQVWVNLLTNAIKFTAPKPRAQIEVNGRVSGAERVYFVRDNGVGFDMRFADKLFGVFQRLHSPQEFDGTGIGLAIVDRIVKRHGGRVEAEGRVNEGAEFRFSLPAEGTPPG